jgi:hypothetical protein
MAMAGAHVALSTVLASALCEQAPWTMEETRRENKQSQSTFLMGVLRDSVPRHPTSSSRQQSSVTLRRLPDSSQVNGSLLPEFDKS